MQPVTNEGFETNLQYLRQILSSKEVRDRITTDRASQYVGEIDLLKTSSLCDVNAMNSMRDRMSGVNAKEIQRTLANTFYNPDAMHATMCAVNSTFYTSPFDIGSLYLNGRIRSYIHNLELLSQTGDELVFRVDFDDASRIFVVKTSELDERAEQLLHEMIVGLYGTNRLRAFVPNFAYVFGGFKCSPPIVGLDKKVKTWCLNNENPVNYVLYENIAPGKSLTAHIRDGCTSKEFANYFLQILYSENLAHEMIDFTHYNLTCDNVFLRQLNNKSYIPYISEERVTEYILTDKIATIINYDYAHFKTADLVDSMGHTTRVGLDFGAYGFVEYSIFPTKSFPISDMYKLLMTSYVKARKYENNQVANLCERIYTYFSADSISESALKQQTYSYTLYRNEKTSTLSLDNLAKYIRAIFSTEDFMFRYPDQSTKVLNCDTVYGGCPSEDEIYKSIGLDPKSELKVPTSVIGLYDLGIRLQNEQRTAELKTLAQKFEYNEAMARHIDRMNELLNELAAYTARITTIDLSKVNIQSKTVLLRVVETYNALSAMADAATNLKFHYRIGVSVANSFDRKDSISEMDLIASTYNTNIKPFFDQAKVVAIANHEYLDTVKITDPDYAWYNTERRRYDVVLSSLVNENL